MPRYEWHGASPFRDRRNDRVIEPGDVVELDTHVAETQPEFARVEDDSGGGSERGDEPPDEASPPFDPTDLTVGELESELSDGDFSGAELEALATAEGADGSPRSTALEAIEATLADAEIGIDRRLDPLGATGAAPAVYVTDPFGYLLELKAERK